MGIFKQPVHQPPRYEKKHTILIVDDEDANRKALSSLLDERYHVLTAHDGMDALDLVNRLKEKDEHGKIHLIISDQRMPRMLGVDFLEKVAPILPRAKLIILTGFTDISAILDAINKAGIYKYIMKPYDRDDMLLTIKRALEVYDLQAELDAHHESLEEQVKERTQALELEHHKRMEMQQQLILQERIISLGVLTAGIADQLKNPLNFVNNLAELAMEDHHEQVEILECKKDQLGADYETIDELNQAMKDNLALIAKNGRRMNTIVESMMLLAREDAGAREVTDVSALLLEHVDLAYHTMHANHDEFEVAREVIKPEADYRIFCVPQSICRIFVSLLNNAMEAMYDRQQNEPDHQLKLQVTIALEGNWVHVEIVDNGTGIPAENMDLISNHFFSTRSSEHGHVGLGIPVSLEIIQEHRGEIQFESELGNHTKVTISLPRQWEDEHLPSE